MSAESRAAEVPQFYGFDLFEHYEAGGHLLLVTSDANAIRLEPGDFVVKRLWSTATMPYVHNRAAVTPDGGDQP